MPRPTNKKDLVQQAQTEHQALEQLINSLSKDELTTPLVTSHWTTKDVLAHLSEWEQMALAWHYTAQRGEQPMLPAKGYTWRQIPELNQAIYLKCKDASLKSVLERFKQSYQEILGVIQGLSESELYDRGHFPWTKENTLATYLISATSSHYRWAYARIKRKLRPTRSIGQSKAVVRTQKQQVAQPRGAP